MGYGSFRIGYGHEAYEREGRGFSDTGEDIVRLSYDAMGLSFLAIRLGFDYGQRRGEGFVISGSDYEEGPGGTQPGLRYYDEADRNRTRASVLISANPHQMASIYFQYAHGKDEYLGDESIPEGREQVGLLDSDYDAWNVGATINPNEKVAFGINYGEDSWGAFQKSRNAARRPTEDAGAPRLLAGADSIAVCQGLSDYAHPSAGLAARLGARAESVLGLISGTTSQPFVADAARAIAPGKRDIVLIAGGEAEHSARRLKRAGGTPQRTPAGGGAPDVTIGVQMRREDWKGPDIAAGLASPAGCLAVFETALRHRLGLSVAAHRERIAALWARNARVAAENPHGWVKREPSAAEIATRP